jgi:hypothetical protein
MLVHSGAEKGNVTARIFRGARLEILNDLSFRKRAGKIERRTQPEFFRYGCEKLVDRARSDGGQQFLALGRGFREIAHQAECYLVCSEM